MGMVFKFLKILKLLVSKKTPQGLKISTKGNKNNEIVLADTIGLAATGRKPNLDNLGLENINIEINKGAIVVDQYNCTNQPNIYAVGDCTNRINLTPVAINEGRLFADSHFGKSTRIMNYENVPSAIFSNPEAATVGLTEFEASEQ